MNPRRDEPGVELRDWRESERRERSGRVKSSGEECVAKLTIDVDDEMDELDCRASSLDNLRLVCRVEESGLGVDEHEGTGLSNERAKGVRRESSRSRDFPKRAEVRSPL